MEPHGYETKEGDEGVFLTSRNWQCLSQWILDASRRVEETQLPAESATLKRTSDI
jgi:hypothetical protein